MELVNQLRAAVVGLLYPRRAICMGCGDMLGLDRDDLCEACRSKLAQGWIGQAAVRSFPLRSSAERGRNRSMKLVNQLRAAVVGLLYPRRAICMGCGEMLGLDRDDLCEACRSKLAQGWIGPTAVRSFPMRSSEAREGRIDA